MYKSRAYPQRGKAKRATKESEIPNVDIVDLSIMPKVYQYCYKLCSDIGVPPLVWMYSYLFCPSYACRAYACVLTGEEKTIDTKILESINSSLEKCCIFVFWREDAKHAPTKCFGYDSLWIRQYIEVNGLNGDLPHDSGWYYEKHNSNWKRIEYKINNYEEES